MFLSKTPALPLLWIFMQLGTEVRALRVDLQPKGPLFRAGDTQHLRCSVTDCAEKLTITWGLLQDVPMPAKIHTAGRESVATFDPVKMEHDGVTLICKVTCGRQKRQPHTAINVYSFPEDPVVSGHERLLLGQESPLHCSVPHAHPADRLTVAWLRGEELMPSHAADMSAGAVRSTYTVTPMKEDAGSDITCRATLDLPGVPAEERVRETTVSLAVLYAPQNMSISESAVVKVGSRLALSCFAEGSPAPAMEWTFISEDGREVTLGQGEELLIANVTLSQSGEYRCVAKNTLGSQAATVDVTVIAPPMGTSVWVTPGAEVQEGVNVTVACLSDGGGPVERMVLTIRGRLGELASSDHSSSVSHTWSPAEPRDSGVYQCEAFNQYGMELVSTSLTVAAYPLELEPMPSVMVAERGSSVMLTCHASGCPQPLLEWRTHTHILAGTEGPLLQLRLGPLGLSDEADYVCQAECGSVVRMMNTTVQVFSFASDPLIENHGSVLEGEEARLVCTVTDVYPANLLTLQWLAGDKELQSVTGPVSSDLANVTSVLSYRLGPEDDGKLLTCRATLDVGERSKEAHTTLQLHHPPRGTLLSVSPSGEVKEGENVTVSCTSDGAPVERMVLRRVSEEQETELTSSDNSSFLSFTLSSAALEDSGVYRCEASNQHGTQRAEAQVVVKAPPRNTTVLVFPSPNVKEGQNVTVCCRSVSFPPPTVVLKKLGNDTAHYSPDGTFQLVNVTAGDAGVYQVNVTNDLGYDTEVFTINVTEERATTSAGLTEILVPVVCACAALATLALVLDYVRRSRKRASYQLANKSAT